MNVFRAKAPRHAPAAILLACLTAQGAMANSDLAESQARIGCESYAETLLGVADGWRFENDGQTFDLRQQSAGEDLGLETFQGMFEAVNHRGLKRFLNDTLQYLWEDEQRARRFITSGRFMSECLPANTELMKRQLHPSSQAEIRDRLNRIRQGVAQGITPVTPEQRPISRQAAQSPQYVMPSAARNTSEYRNSGNQQSRQTAGRSNQQQQPASSSGLSSRR